MSEEFQVGPYCCVPHAAPSPTQRHVGAALIRRQLDDGPREARLVFEEELFETPEEALAYAAARADYLLRFAADKVVSF